MPRKDKFSLLIIIFISLLASRTLFKPGYFPMHDDLQMMRQLQMEKCFLDGQIPCRWVPDMGFGFGVPLFNFYPPLPYLIGEIFRLLGFAFTSTVRLNFVLSIVASGISMYFLAKKFFGRIGGILSSVFYVWAPYHAVDVYVRGAMNEAWALVWFPLIFLFSYELITSTTKSKIVRNVVFLAIFYFALLLSHNLMVLIFTPFLGLWVLLNLWRENAWNRFLYLLVSGLWALGLAAFFTIPALMENQFTQVRSQLTGYYDYRAHFVSIRQLLFSRFWGYGPSVWVEAEDKMSFQIGHLHWMLSLVIGLLLLIRFIRKKGNILIRIKSDRLLVISSFLLLVGWFSAYMTHLKSSLIYNFIPQLSYIQFPWRFLTIAIFVFSFLMGFLPFTIAELKLKRGFFLKLFVSIPQVFLSVLLIFTLIILNWNYFKVERTGLVTDEEKFSGEAWRIQQTAGIYDYLPIYAKVAPKSSPSASVEIVEGKGIISEIEKGTYYTKFYTKVESEKASIRLSTLFFPGWRAFVKKDLNQEELKIYVPINEEWGRIWVDLPKGEHIVLLYFFNTPVRTYSNLISIISFALLLTYPKWKNRVELKRV